MNIIEKLDDLIYQATHERSHYYTAEVLAEAKRTLTQAFAALARIRALVGCARSSTDTELRIDAIAGAVVVVAARSPGPKEPRRS